MRRRLLTVVALVVLAASWWLPAGQASAHARLIGSTPETHGIVDAGQRELRLRFNEAVRPVAGGFAVYDGSGAHWPATVAGLDAEVRITLPAQLPHGSYWVSWRVVSADDHPIGGLVAVGLGRPYQETVAPPAGTTSVGAAAPLQIGLHAVGTLGLLVAAGLFGYAALVSGRRPNGLLLAVTGSAALLGTIGASGIGPTTGLVLAGAALTVGLPRVGVPVRVAWTVGPVVALSSLVLVGHTRTTGPGWLVLPAGLVHVACAALWLGGVVALAGQLRAARRAAGEARDAAALVARFSLVAGGMVVALGASGVALALVLLGSPARLLDTDHGRALLGKLTVVAAVAVLAAVNHYWLVPAVGRPSSGAARWRRLRGAVRDEIVLLVAVVCLTSLLASLPPGRSADQPAPASLSRGAAVGTATVRAAVAPGVVGVNTVDVTVLAGSGKPVRPLSPPRLRATRLETDAAGIDAELRELSPGRYRAELPVPAAGDWELELWVRTDTYSEPSAVWTLSVR